MPICDLDAIRDYKFPDLKDPKTWSLPQGFALYDQGSESTERYTIMLSANTSWPKKNIHYRAIPAMVISKQSIVLIPLNLLIGPIRVVVEIARLCILAIHRTFHILRGFVDVVQGKDPHLSGLVQRLENTAETLSTKLSHIVSAIVYTPFLILAFVSSIVRPYQSRVYVGEIEFRLNGKVSKKRDFLRDGQVVDKLNKSTQNMHWMAAQIARVFLFWQHLLEQLFSPEINRVSLYSAYCFQPVGHLTRP